MGLAVATLRKQNDKSGEPIGARPAFVIVGPTLESAAREVLTAEVVESTSNTMRGVARLVVEPRLESSRYPNNSAARWYLLGDPRSVAPFVLGTVGGSPLAPSVETLPTTPERFAMAWRSRIDFAIAQNDPRGAVRSEGA
jgi:hypothetical protein